MVSLLRYGLMSVAVVPVSGWRGRSKRVMAQVVTR